MQMSRVKSRDGNNILMEQKAKGRFLFFSKAAYVLLNVRETPYEKIQFTDVAKKDFDFYDGSWTLLPTEHSLTISYLLTMKSKTDAPRAIKKHVMKNSVTELLEQVKKEMLRRADPN
jgi:hypothetical protein